MAAGAGAEFAHLLRLERIRARLTQAELADLAGLGVRTIRDLESGRVRQPHRDTVRLLSAALELGGETRERLVEAARPFPNGHRPDLLAAAEEALDRAAELARVARERMEGARGAPRPAGDRAPSVDGARPRPTQAGRTLNARGPF